MKTKPPTTDRARYVDWLIEYHDRPDVMKELEQLHARVTRSAITPYSLGYYLLPALKEAKLKL